MHIADGILSAPVLAAGFAGTAALAAFTLRKVDVEDIPKISVVTSAFFVASLIHVPIGPTSLHLILNGLVGVILGWRAFPAILLGLVLQAIIFGHGGISVLGVNALMLGGGALVAYAVWRLRHYFAFRRRETVFGALAGAVGILSSGAVLALALATTGDAFAGIAATLFAVHFPLMLVEGAVAAACVEFLMRVKPQLLDETNAVTTPKPAQSSTE
jgi:cobalt/nickel transport system permease protein